MERLKLEVARFQRAHADQADRGEKQKKQNDVLDQRIQELKKAQGADQAEIKDLRVKLRMSEHERTQLAAKSGEAGELKKALQALDLKRREEIKERDRKLADLEKSVAGEKKRKEALEGKLKEMIGKGDQEIEAVREVVGDLKAQLMKSRDETEAIWATMTALEDQTASREDYLLEELDKHRLVLARVTTAYSQIASSTIPNSTYALTKQQNANLCFQNARLERKLATSEEQVVQLANLIRQMKEEQSSLLTCLCMAEEEASFYSQALLNSFEDQRCRDAERAEWQSLESAFAEITKYISQSEIGNSHREIQSLTSDFYRLQCEDLCLAYSAAEAELQEKTSANQRYACEMADAVAAKTSLVAQLQEATDERDLSRELLKAAQELSQNLQASLDLLKDQLKGLETKLLDIGAVHETALKKEHDTIHRLTQTLQKGRMTEDGLRAEVEQ